MTRAELLRHALASALSKARLKNARLGLSEETRWEIAGEAIAELRRYGGWQALDEEAPMRSSTATNPDDKRESWKVKPERRNALLSRAGLFPARLRRPQEA
jgi:hypothetical protein